MTKPRPFLHWTWRRGLGLNWSNWLSDWVDLSSVRPGVWCSVGTDGTFLSVLLDPVVENCRSSRVWSDLYFMLIPAEHNLCSVHQRRSDPICCAPVLTGRSFGLRWVAVKPEPVKWLTARRWPCCPPACRSVTGPGRRLSSVPDKFRERRIWTRRDLRV